MGGGRKLFGTDGIRGTANVDPMTVEVAQRLGQAETGLSPGFMPKPWPPLP